SSADLQNAHGDLEMTANRGSERRLHQVLRNLCTAATTSPRGRRAPLRRNQLQARRSRGSRLRSAVLGFSVVELMVAMAISLLLLAGVVAIFSSSRSSYETTTRLSRIQENGR